MTERTVKEKIQDAIDLAQDQANHNKVMAECRLDGNGDIIRGRVRSVVCAGCKHRRWDDGTACKQVDHRGKVCGHRVREDENRMEEGRLD